jgi:hypothetical protein
LRFIGSQGKCTSIYLTPAQLFLFLLAFTESEVPPMVPSPGSEQKRGGSNMAVKLKTLKLIRQ